MSAFSSAKANTEFELKFTAPAALLLGVAEPIANKTAVYMFNSAPTSPLLGVPSRTCPGTRHTFPGPVEPSRRISGPKQSPP